jgi:type 1 glutamine amidotransferase
MMTTVPAPSRQPLNLCGAALAVLTLLLPGCSTPHRQAKSEIPLQALLVTGGCCHNYPFQTEALTNALSARSEIEWTVVNEGGRGTRARIPLYDDPQWASNYDIVVHNECFADTDDPDYIRRITEAHRTGTPAVVIHCAMHTYRESDIHDWREFLGVTSRRHDHQSRYAVKPVAPRHPVMREFPETWTTPMDELYVIDKLWPNAQALATSMSESDGKAYPVMWVNRYGNARVFGTTYGHTDETFQDPVFLNTVARGFLWAAGRLD